MKEVNRETVRAIVARLLDEQMGIDPVQCLRDTPFDQLHEQFDSLTFLELQLLLEKELDMEFDDAANEGPLPTNVSEMADLVVGACDRHRKNLALHPRRDAPAGERC